MEHGYALPLRDLSQYELAVDTLLADAESELEPGQRYKLILHKKMDWKIFGGTQYQLAWYANSLMCNEKEWPSFIVPRSELDFVRFDKMWNCTVGMCVASDMKYRKPEKTPKPRPCK